LGMWPLKPPASTIPISLLLDDQIVPEVPLTVTHPALAVLKY